MKKCGTGAFAAFAKLNPNFKVSNHVEAHFLYEKNLWQLGPEFYKNFLPEAEQSDVVYEGTPRYFVEKSVLNRVKEINPDMKFILILCDPIKECLNFAIFPQKYQNFQN